MPPSEYKGVTHSQFILCYQLLGKQFQYGAALQVLLIAPGIERKECVRPRLESGLERSQRRRIGVCAAVV